MNRKSTIGEKLLEAREKTGMSLRDIAQANGLPLSRLESLENDQVDFEKVDVYDISCLKVYCFQIGLVYDDLIKGVKLKPIDLSAHQYQPAGSFFKSIDTTYIFKLTTVVIVGSFLIYFLIQGASISPKPASVNSHTIEQFEL